MTHDELRQIVSDNTETFRQTRAILTAVEAYSSASNNGKPDVSGALPGWAAELLTEVRFRLLVDIDQDGEPSSSMAELLEMWDKVNKSLDIKTIGQ